MGKTSDRSGAYLLPPQTTLQAACGNRSGSDSTPVAILVNSLSNAVTRLFEYTWHSVVLLLPSGEWKINLFSIRVDIFPIITIRTVSAGKNRTVCVDTFPFTWVRHRQDACDTRHLHPTRFPVLFGVYPRIFYITTRGNFTPAKLAGFQSPDAL